MVRLSVLAMVAGFPVAAFGQAMFLLEPSGESGNGDSAMSFDGSNFLVFYEDDRGIPGNAELYAMFVSPQGQPQSDWAFMVSSGPYTGYPDACFGGGQHFVVYEGAWGGGAVPQVIGTRVRPDGTVLDPTGIAIFSNQQTAHAIRPQVASNGQRYCVAWGDDLLMPGEKPLQFAMVGLDGAIEVGPVNIPGTDLAGTYNTDMTTDGTDFYLVWDGPSGVMLTRISAAGAVLGTTMVHPTNSYYIVEPKIGYNGDSLLVSWFWNGTGAPTLSAKRVSTSGAAIGSAFSVPGAGSAGVPVSIVRSGSEFVLFSFGGTNSTPSLGQLLYTRISASGSIVEPATVYMPGYSPGVSGRASMAMGTGGTALSAVALSFAQGQPARMHGQILEFGSACYANCDESTAAPALNVSDFGCFLNRFAAGDPYANCDGSTGTPQLNVGDFGCFLTKFAAGCP